CSVDAVHLGNVSRFINHSCAPNCEAVYVCQGNSAVRPHSLVLIRACRDILPGEELTLSYSSSKQCFRPSDLRYIK
ncbi:nuclear protein SET, partial [Haematococcus lacustris]